MLRKMSDSTSGEKISYQSKAKRLLSDTLTKTKTTQKSSSKYSMTKGLKLD